jgi:hypothetical protein
MSIRMRCTLRYRQPHLQNQRDQCWTAAVLKEMYKANPILKLNV